MLCMLITSVKNEHKNTSVVRTEFLLKSITKGSASLQK